MKAFGLLVILMGSMVAEAKCSQFVQLVSAKAIAKDMGSTEDWVLANYKINLWKNQSSQGKHPAVGKLIPGSNALLIEEASQDYKVVSPLDRSVGWISKVQVRRKVLLDDKTFSPCNPN